nr:sigma 54-interacting transcriptional regulator [Bacteroidota bacterium]
MPKRIIILDTPEKNLEPLGDAFTQASDDQCAITYIHSAQSLMTKLRTGLPWDLLILDGTLGDGQKEGLKLLTNIRNIYPELPIVVVAEQGNVDIVHQAIQAGANDFLVRSGKLVDRVATLLKKVKPHLTLIDRNRMLLEQNMLLQEAAVQRFQIVGESPQIMEIFDKIEKVAKIPRPVLITGERGTGKELVARGIHQAAGDGTRPMVVVN